MTATPRRLRVDSRNTGLPRKDRHVLTAVYEKPRLSWTVPLTQNGQRQTAFEILPPGGGAAILRESDEPWFTVVEPLEPDRDYNWAVRVRDERNRWSDWAEASFETAPFNFSQWHADWLSVAARSVLREKIELTAGAVRARLHLTAQGLVRALINGVVVNADSSDPSRTDFTRALSRTYDVTDLLRTGQNAIEILVANGDWERTGFDPRVLVRLVIDTPDNREVLTSGASWGATESTLATSIPFYREKQDATRTSFSSRPVSLLPAESEPATPEFPPLLVSPDPGPPIRLGEAFEAAPISGGEGRVFQLATNIAGRSRITIKGGVPRGTQITVIHGEGLNDLGSVDTTNLTMPFDEGRLRQVVEYVATGEVDQILEPWFCYHGFAFLEIFGLPVEATIEVQGRALHSDLESTSRVSTDSSKIQALQAAARRTLLNNVHGLPEDCPTREQAGWTGDTASAADFEFAAFDMQAFFDKWLGDLRTSQQANGALPAVSPDLHAERVPADPAWGAALPRVLFGHWLTYGDRRVVTEYLPVLREWVRFLLEARDDEGLIGCAPISFGHDWLALEQTPPRLIHTAAAIDALETLIRLESVAGTADSRLASSLAQLRAAARLRFSDSSQDLIGNGSQASRALGIHAGITPAAAEQARMIADDVRARGDRVSSGFAATRQVVESLADAGYSQLLADVISQPEEPGIGAMLDHGPGTFWENWWIDPANTGTGSLDHVGLGAPFAAWVERDLAGIRPLGAGYSRAQFRPRFIRDVGQLRYTLTTVRGDIEVAYQVSDGLAEIDLIVPVGCNMRVDLPGRDAFHVLAGRHHFIATIPRPSERNRPRASDPWHPPSPLPMAGDQAGGAEWNLRALDAAALRLIDDGLECMPIPHAQLRGPVAEVEGIASLTFSPPLDLSGATFVYAYVDSCAWSDGPTDITLTAHASSDVEIRATARAWFAGWNRVAIDVSGWSGRRSLTSVKVRATGAAATDSTVHIGAIGYSSRPRTW